MSVKTSLKDDGKTQVISVDGRFDYKVHREFRDAYQQQPESVKRYIVELDHTNYIDSSALGMLLLLRDHAGGDKADIVITGANPEVKKVLTISNFTQIFQVL